MAVTDILSILMPLGIDPAYYGGACFKVVTDPKVGDFGMFGYDSMQLALHTVTLVGDHEIFQKANPGWDRNPWEIISISSTANIKSYFPDKKDSDFKWARYTPSFIVD